MKRPLILLYVFLCLAFVWLFLRNRDYTRKLDHSYTAHARTLEYVAAAQMALDDNSNKAVALASETLEEAQVLAAVFYSSNKIFQKDVMFIMEFNDERVLRSSELTSQQRTIFEKYMKESRSR